jgi:hypothetical protein
MDRRCFVGIVGAIGALPRVAPAQTRQAKARCYALDTYTLAGTQHARLSEYLSKSYLPALARIHSRAALVLNDISAPNPPQVAVLTGYQSVEEMWSVRAKLTADKALEVATDAWQAGQEKPFEAQATTHLEAAGYSPDLVALNPQPATPRLFEMRVYHANTARGHRGLHERFEEAEVRILTNCGATPILFSSTVAGADMPNLTWMIAFADAAARDKFSKAFSADPEWAKLRAQSMERYGQIPNSRKITLFQAAPFSPIR